MLLGVAVIIGLAGSAQAQIGLYDSQGTFHGYWNSNPYDPNSIANPYGRYGSPYSPDSINNPFSPWGNPYSSEGVGNSDGVGRSHR
jgi:hypothetical protein